jgi:hypothetical protein
MFEKNKEPRNEFLAGKIAELKSTLLLIAQPPRSDGTYNRDRKACQILAQKTLDNLNID